MRLRNKIYVASWVLFFLAPIESQAQQDSARSTLILRLDYFMNNNRVVYLMANTKTKVAGKFQPVKEIPVSIYLDINSPENLVAKTITDEKGLGKVVIPPSLKLAWDGKAKHSFLAVSADTKQFASTDAETIITKSKITIDTLSDSGERNIIVRVSSLNGEEWIPAGNVEMKIGVKRSPVGILPVGEEQTYTTDSTGTVTAAYKIPDLPGDAKGNIILVAKVEENDEYGNLLVEKTVPWGVAVQPDRSFYNQRTLWSTRFRTPIWLLFMAYSIIIGVWGTIIYLVFQIIRIKKLGTIASAGANT